MVSQGVFYFKGLQFKSSGEFTNDKGVVIKYDESVVLKFDELEQDEKGNPILNERFIKIKNLKDNAELVDKLKKFALQSKIKLTFENKFTKDGGVVLNLIDAEESKTAK